jgi:hypothetical protein
MAKTNYQQLRRQKETARKTRQQEKLDRRLQRNAPESPPADTDPSRDSATLPVEHARK